MWNNSKFEVSNSEYGNSWIGLYGKHVGSDFHCYVIGIYAPCNLQDRQQIWDDLCLFRSAFEVPWIVPEDFNKTLSRRDKSSGICHQAGSASFSRFIVSRFIGYCELVEYPLSCWK